MYQLFIFTVMSWMSFSAFSFSADERAEIKSLAESNAISITYAYPSSAFCNGIALTPRIVLTAGHCADGSDGTAYVRSYRTTDIRVLQQITHPRFPGLKSIESRSKQKKLQPIDIGILILEKDLPGVVPVKFYINKNNSYLSKESRLYLVKAESSWGSIQYLDIQAHPNLNVFSTNVGVREDGYFGSGGSIAGPGSSGAPTFVRAQDGSWLLVGVLSAGETKKSEVKVYHTFASTALEWLSEMIQYRPEGY